MLSVFEMILDLGDHSHGDIAHDHDHEGDHNHEHDEEGEMEDGGDGERGIESGSGYKYLSSVAMIVMLALGSSL